MKIFMSYMLLAPTALLANRWGRADGFLPIFHEAWMPSKTSEYILFIYFWTLVMLLLVQLKKETFLSIYIFCVCMIKIDLYYNHFCLHVNVSLVFFFLVFSQNCCNSSVCKTSSSLQWGKKLVTVLTVNGSSWSSSSTLSSVDAICLLLVTLYIFFGREALEGSTSLLGQNKRWEN